MKRCPFCFLAPTITFKYLAGWQFWEMGCDQHFPGIVRQETLEQAQAAWNQLTIHEYSKVA